IPFGGPTHERLAQVDDESPQTTSSGDVWAQIQHGTCNSSANATGFERALTYSPPFFVRAHQTTKEDCRGSRSKRTRNVDPWDNGQNCGEKRRASSAHTVDKNP